MKVSFVRHRDVHILTSGEQTFTSDQRFSARHNSEDEWVLLIKYVQVQYLKISKFLIFFLGERCWHIWVSNSNKTFPVLSYNIKYHWWEKNGKLDWRLFILVNLSVPRVRIQGSPDLHVNRGSTINLTCIISHTPEPPSYIFWYFNDNVIAYDSPR